MQANYYRGVIDCKLAVRQDTEKDFPIYPRLGRQINQYITYYYKRFRGSVRIPERYLEDIESILGWVLNY